MKIHRLESSGNAVQSSPISHPNCSIAVRDLPLGAFGRVHKKVFIRWPTLFTITITLEFAGKRAWHKGWTPSILEKRPSIGGTEKDRTP